MSETIGDAECEHLGLEEIVARSAIYPKFNNEEGEFEFDLLLDPTKDKKSNKKMPSYGISVASRKLLVCNDNIHKYGCRTAATQNKRAAERAEEKGVPSPPVRYYLGFYEIEVSQVLQAASENCNVRVVLKPEGGEEAHCEVILSPPRDSNKEDYADARANALIEIAERLSQPERHICDCDEAHREELSKIVLPLPLKRTAAAD